MVKQLTLLLTVVLLGGCVVPTKVGGYAVSGTVTDKHTAEPISGVRVEVSFSTTSVWEANRIVAAIGITDAEGVFTIEVPRRTHWGGTGGLAGRAEKWPSLYFRKNGYCSIGRGFLEGATEKFQNMDVKIGTQDRGCH